MATRIQKTNLTKKQAVDFAHKLLNGEETRCGGVVIEKYGRGNWGVFYNEHSNHINLETVEFGDDFGRFGTSCLTDNWSMKKIIDTIKYYEISFRESIDISDRCNICEGLYNRMNKITCLKEENNF